jgi:hypothetical protein
VTGKDNCRQPAKVIDAEQISLALNDFFDALNEVSKTSCYPCDELARLYSICVAENSGMGKPL